MKREPQYASLKAWREAHDLSQRDVAKILGVSQSCYAKIELQRRSPRRELAKRLMAKTHVPLDSLMGIR